jgi:hypothetical protein
MEIDLNNFAHVVWEQQDLGSTYVDRNVYYSEGDLNSTTPIWSTPRAITDASEDWAGFDPAIAVDTSPTPGVHVLYVHPIIDNERAELYYTKKSDWSSTPTPELVSWPWPTPPPNIFIHILHPEVSISANGVYATWSSHVPSSFFHSNHEIFFNKKALGTWQTPVQVSNTDGTPCPPGGSNQFIFEYHPSLYIESSELGDVLHFAYERHNDDNGNPNCPGDDSIIEYKKGLASANFLNIAPTPLSTPGSGWDRSPHILIDDDRHVIWRQEANQTSDRGVFYRKYSFGTGWSGAFRIEGPAGLYKDTSNANGTDRTGSFWQDKPEISFEIDSDGYLYVSYVGDDWGQSLSASDIYFTWGSGLTANGWSNPIRIGKDKSYFNQHVQIRLEGSNNYPVVIFDERLPKGISGQYWDILVVNQN